MVPEQHKLINSIIRLTLKSYNESNDEETSIEKLIKALNLAKGDRKSLSDIVQAY